MSFRADNWARRALVVCWLTGLYLPPDRRLLERVILPWYARQGWCRRVLFVGVRVYVRHYPRLFRDREYVTIDRNPRMRWFGARRHIVDSVEHLDRHVPAGHFDVVILNGVLGWGVNDTAAAAVTLDACRRALRLDGHLVIGVNDSRMRVSDADAVTLASGFTPWSFPALAARRIDLASPLAERSHTYLFYRAAGG
jgi:hypothetical protein